ncbi:MAG: TIGR02301 family protein [Pseudomonadota bacterium]
MLRVVSLLAMIYALIAMPAFGQSAGVSDARPSRLDSRFLSQKRDLASVLGEVHYIRTLCNGKGDQYWRNHMRAFLDIEAASSSRRRMLVDAFNRGYANLNSRLDACTPDVAVMEARLSEEGRKLAETIAAGYLQ